MCCFTLQAKAANPKAKPPAPNPLLLGLSPSAHVLRVVSRVRSAELEQALLLLPFTDALRLMRYLVAWLQQGTQVGGAGSRGTGWSTPVVKLMGVARAPGSMG